MDTIQIARRLAELGQTGEAQAAYTLALQEAAERNPELELEAASYLFFSRGSYQVAYTSFVSLYNRGLYRAELLDLMTQAFYLPNVEKQRRQYERTAPPWPNIPISFGRTSPPLRTCPSNSSPSTTRGMSPFSKRKTDSISMSISMIQ